jgi:hypothetical protein
MAVASEKHIALPKCFSGDSDFDEWIVKFEICAAANTWNSQTQAKKLPTLLEGDALMVYLEVPEGQRNDYSVIKAALKKEFLPHESRFQAMTEFEGRKQFPGESAHAFLFNLKRLLDRALPDLEGQAKEDILLHHFIDGLPRNIGQQLRGLPEVTTTAEALTRARLLSTSLNTDIPVASVNNAQVHPTNSRLDRIEEMVVKLSEKLAHFPEPEQQGTSAIQKQTPNCQICSQYGHVARNCRRNIRCYNCGKLGHFKRECRLKQVNRTPSRVRENNYSTSVAQKHMNHPSTIIALVGNLDFHILFDSGSSISLVRKDVIVSIKATSHKSTPINVITASCGKMKLSDIATLPLQIGPLITKHDAYVSEHLIVPVILGTDFMKRHGIHIDFNTDSVSAHNLGKIWPLDSNCIVRQPSSYWHNSYTVAAVISDDEESCYIPPLDKSKPCNIPKSPSAYVALLNSFITLFSPVPGKTEVIQHCIITETSKPVRVPPRRVPAHYKEEVSRQIDDMLKLNIISESSSPWAAPCVFVPKKNGELRICIDYRELNKRTQKNSYPLPLPDEVQDTLGNATVFSKLDCRKGFWQVPIHPDDRYKTAFSPGPGMGLYEFNRMPFGLTGAPGTFQSLMDQVLRGLNQDTHIRHLEAVLQRLQECGLTLHSEKCVIGCTQVLYLGHIFSQCGMSPDPMKVSAISNWPIPMSSSDVRTFLGLASYYRRYVKNFAKIAEPLYRLTDKGQSFQWDQNCQQAFSSLKQALLSHPILTTPDFNKEFQIFTDASDVGLGVILHQGDSIIACASRTLKPAEKNYSVIEKECLALVYAVKQFWHYLLGKPVIVFTNHNPLQWLSSQKMEGKLARWALAMQEYDFTIKYRRGNQNQNADALSRHPSDVRTAVTELQVGFSDADIRCCQQEDNTIHQIIKYKQTRPTKSQLPLCNFNRWLQIWPQLFVIDGILYRQCFSPLSNETRTLLIVPNKLRPHFLQQCHDIPCAGNQGFVKTLDRLRQSAYWIGMALDVQKYCDTCDSCHCSKPVLPKPVPLISTPIGRPSEMLGVDVLQVPMSTRGNAYLLVL